MAGKGSAGRGRRREGEKTTSYFFFALRFSLTNVAAMHSLRALRGLRCPLGRRRRRGSSSGGARGRAGGSCRSSSCSSCCCPRFVAAPTPALAAAAPSSARGGVSGSGGIGRGNRLRPDLTVLRKVHHDHRHVVPRPAVDGRARQHRRRDPRRGGARSPALPRPRHAPPRERDGLGVGEHVPEPVGREDEAVVCLRGGVGVLRMR